MEDAHGNTVAVHRGFFEYMEVLAPRVNEYRNWLESECGIEIDFITGHSLGGAAATLYADVYGEPLGTNGDHYLGVVTFGAPATHNTEWFRRRLEDYDSADLDCDTDDNDCIGCIATKHRDIQVEGIRFVNADDWVPSGLSGYEHIISHYENSECSEPDGATCDGIEACHILTPGYDWVHKKRFVLPARPSKDLTPRPTPRPTSRPAPRPIPRPTQRPVSSPGGAACQTLVDLCMDAETQSECDRSYKFDDGDYRTCYWNGNRCKFSDGNAEVCVGGGPSGAAACQTLVDLCMDSETRSECEQSYKFHEDAYRTCYWNGERCKFSDGNAEICVDGGPRPDPRPTPRPTRKPTPSPTRKPTPRPTRTPTPRPVSEPALLATDKEESESKSSGKKSSSVIIYVVGASLVAALILCAFTVGFYCKKGKKENPIEKPVPITSAVPEFKETKSPQEPKRDHEASVPSAAAMMTSPV